jgi:hypothetical protein
MESYFPFKTLFSIVENTLGFLFLSFSAEAILSVDNQIIIPSHSAVY